MIAGDDVRRLEPVIRGVQEEIDPIATPTQDQVEAALRRNWRDAQRDLIEAEVLGIYGYDRATFLKDGRRDLGDSKFADVMAEVSVFSDLQCDLLVCGFDEFGRARILTVSGKGAISDCTRNGCWAIGSGAFIAIDALYHSKLSRDSTWKKAAYQACHAKFMSERATGVGQKTVVIGLRNDGSTLIIDKREHLDPIRAYWVKHTRPQFPKDFESIIPDDKWVEPHE